MGRSCGLVTREALRGSDASDDSTGPGFGASSPKLTSIENGGLTAFVGKPSYYLY